MCPFVSILRYNTLYTHACCYVVHYEYSGGVVLVVVDIILDTVGIQRTIYTTRRKTPVLPHSPDLLPLMQLRVVHQFVLVPVIPQLSFFEAVLDLAAGLPAAVCLGNFVGAAQYVLAHG